MAVDLSEEAVLSFQVKLGSNANNIELFALLKEYYSFLRTSFANLVNYYLGNRNSLDYDDIEKLNKLKSDFGRLLGFMRNSNQFSSFYDWEMFDLITDMNDNLYVIDNLGKFLKSSSKSARVSSSYTFASTKGKGKTLERVSFDKLENDNYDNEWVDIARDNDLSERDYDINESKLITLRVELNSTGASTLTNFVDNPDGENILGKDLNRLFTFVDNDVEVLGYKETFYQSVDILTNLQKFQVPEFITLGRGKFVGDNANSFGYSTLVRQLSETYSSDDSISSFSVKDMYLDGTDLIMEIIVESAVAKTSQQTTFKF